MAGLVPGLTTSQGWLPYGSPDSSVVIQHPLTYPLSSANMPYTNVAAAAGGGGPGIGNGPIFDPVKGMLCSDLLTNNTFAAYYSLDTPTFSAAVLAALKNGGQISFEIEAPAVTLNNPAAFSSGFLPSNYAVYGGNSAPVMDLIALGGTERLYVVVNSSGGLSVTYQPGFPSPLSQGYWLLGKRFLTTAGQLTNTAYFNVPAGTGSYNSYRAIASGGPEPQIHSMGKGPFIKVNIGWWGGPYGGLVVIGFDGLKSQVFQRVNTVFPDISWLTKITLGGDSQGVFNAGIPFFIRNLQVSTAIPVWLTKPGFSRGVLFGDSTTPTSGSWDIQFGSGGDVTAPIMLQRAFNQAGYDLDIFELQATGNTIDDNNGSPTSGKLAFWKDAITPNFLGNANYTNPPTVGMPWPHFILVRGGINDFAGDVIGGQVMQNPPVILQDSRFLASAKKLINYWLWGNYTSGVVASGTRTPVKRIIFMTPHSPRWGINGGWGSAAPTQGPGFAQFAFNYVLTALRSLPAWWNASYPLLPGLVSIADHYTNVGGDGYAFTGGIAAGSGVPPNLSIDGVHDAIAGSYAAGQTIVGEVMRVFALPAGS